MKACIYCIVLKTSAIAGFNATSYRLRGTPSANDGHCTMPCVHASFTSMTVLIASASSSAASTMLLLLLERKSKSACRNALGMALPVALRLHHAISYLRIVSRPLPSSAALPACTRGNNKQESVRLQVKSCEAMLLISTNVMSLNRRKGQM